MRTRLGVICLVCAILLAGCGGGGGDDAPMPPPTPARDLGLQSAYVGTLTGSGNLFVVFDENHTLLGVYGFGASTDFRVAGLLYGWQGGGASPAHFTSDEGAVDTGSSGGGTCVSPCRPVRIDLALDSTIPSMSGSVTEPTSSRSVAGGVMPGIGYDPNTPASLKTISGHWDLTTSEGPPLSIDIDANGVVTGGSGACRLHDSAIDPGKSGKNIFAITLRFQEDRFFGCASPSFAGSDGVYGFALAYVLAGGGTQLVIGAANGWDPVYLAAAGKR